VLITSLTSSLTISLFQFLTSSHTPCQRRRKTIEIEGRFRLLSSHSLGECCRFLSKILRPGPPKSFLHADQKLKTSRAGKRDQEFPVPTISCCAARVQCFFRTNSSPFSPPGAGTVVRPPPSLPHPRTWRGRAAPRQVARWAPRESSLSGEETFFSSPLNLDVFRRCTLCPPSITSFMHASRSRLVSYNYHVAQSPALRTLVTF
jgi:hypothetical protein